MLETDMNPLRYIKYVVHRIAFMLIETQGHKHFLRMVEEKRAERIKDYWRVE